MVADLNIPPDIEESQMYEFCKISDGTPVLLNGQAIFVATSKEVAETEKSNVMRVTKVECEITPISETHYIGLWFLTLDGTFYGPTKNVHLAFRTKRAAELYAERFDKRLRAVCAT
jgi:hypothetical protein